MVQSSPGVIRAVPTPENRSSLRAWWHSILGQHGRFHCYALFLANLPGDKKTARYLRKYGREIDRMSGKYCLVIVLGSTEIRFPDFNQQIWEIAVDEHLSDGHSVTAADLFNIDYDDFPCLLLFRDIRSPEHITMSFGQMTTREIAFKMRSIFSTIRQAARDSKDPLSAVEQRQRQESLREKGKLIVSKISGVAEAGFEKAIEVWIETTIDPAQVS